MFNLLIVEDNLIQAHTLCNRISETFPNIKVYSISTLGKDALDIIKKDLVDIILLDLKLPDISGIDILNYISEHKLKKYYQSIIVITGEMSLITHIVGNPYIFDYKSKISINNDLIITLENLLQSKSIDYKELIDTNKFYIIKEKINTELTTLNYNFSYIGTQYLSDCIYEIYVHNGNYSINLNKDIYPILSKKYCKTIDNIKTNINRSTSNMYFDCDEKFLSKYLGYVVASKPNIKDVIFSILNHI